VREREGKKTGEAKIEVARCSIKMNQQNGIDISELQRARKRFGEIEIKDSLIEDNFCDGIHLMYPRSNKPVPRPMRSLVIKVNKNEIRSNKNYGLVMLGDIRPVKVTQN
jgi:hypothetical protein